MILSLISCSLVLVDVLCLIVYAFHSSTLANVQLRSAERQRSFVCWSCVICHLTFYSIQIYRNFVDINGTNVYRQFIPMPTGSRFHIHSNLTHIFIGRPAVELNAWMIHFYQVHPSLQIRLNVAVYAGGGGEEKNEKIWKRLAVTAWLVSSKHLLLHNFSRIQWSNFCLIQVFSHQYFFNHLLLWIVHQYDIVIVNQLDFLQNGTVVLVDARSSRIPNTIRQFRVYGIGAHLWEYLMNRCGKRFPNRYTGFGSMLREKKDACRLYDFIDLERFQMLFFVSHLNQILQIVLHKM